METLEDLLRQNLPSLQAYVRLRAGPVVAAHESLSDLVQSTCREVLEGRDRYEFQGEAAFKSWLFTTAFRKILEKNRYYRAARRDVARHEPRADESDATQSVMDCYMSFATPSQDLAAREQVAAVEAAFARLSEPHREAISMAKLMGLSHEDIAERLGITVQASRQLLRRALLRLATLLDAQAGEGSSRV